MHAPTELFFGLAAVTDVGRLHRRGPQLCYSVESCPLVFRVLVDGLDEVGNQIVTTLQLHVDIAPGVIDPIAAANKAVVEKDTDGGQHDEDENEQHSHRPQSYHLPYPPKPAGGMFVEGSKAQHSEP